MSILSKDNLRLILLFQLKSLEDGASVESIAQYLLTLSSQEGLSLPFKTKWRDDTLASQNSLNQATSPSEEAMLESLWSKITLRIRRHYFERLQNLPTSSPEVAMLDETFAQRLKFTQTLCSFLPEKDVWQKYLQIRVAQFSSNSIQRQLTVRKDRSAPVTFETLVRDFVSLVDVTLAMISDDFRLVNSNVFAHHVTLDCALKEIFLEQIEDDVNFVLEKFENELNEVQPQQVRKGVANGERKQQVRAASKRQSLRNRDTMTPDSTLSSTLEHGFTDLQTLPPDVIERHLNSVVR